MGRLQIGADFGGGVAKQRVGFDAAAGQGLVCVRGDGDAYVQRGAEDNRAVGIAQRQGASLCRRSQAADPQDVVS